MQPKLAPQTGHDFRNAISPADGALGSPLFTTFAPLLSQPVAPHGRQPAFASRECKFKSERDCA
jgi:hypothetical protein